MESVLDTYAHADSVKNYVLKPSAPPPTPVPSPGVHPADLPGGAPPQAGQTQAGPFWAPGTNLTLHFTLSTSPVELGGFGGPLFTWEGIEYGKWDESREWDGSIRTPEVCWVVSDRYPQV